MSDYIPVCDAFYNELEIEAQRKTKSLFIYLKEDKEKTTKSAIKEFIQSEDEEFVLLENNIKIRLDRILQFNNFTPDSLEHMYSFGYGEL